MRLRRLKSEVDSLVAELGDRGFDVVAGGQNWIGDGQYELASPKKVIRLRVTRAGRDELIEFAYRPPSDQSDWNDLGYALIVLGKLSLEEYRRIAPSRVVDKFPFLVSIIDDLEALASGQCVELERRIDEQRAHANRIGLSRLQRAAKQSP